MHISPCVADTIIFGTVLLLNIEKCLKQITKSHCDSQFVSETYLRSRDTNIPKTRT